MIIIYNQSLNKHTSDNRFLYSEIMFGVAQTFVQNLKDKMAARILPWGPDFKQMITKTERSEFVHSLSHIHREQGLSLFVKSL